MQQWLFFLSDNPALRLLQGSLLLFGTIAVFLVCFTTRDIILRTRSFFYQLFAILLVAVLPVFGFFLYLLIRPARTIKERDLEQMLKKIVTFTEETEILTDTVEDTADEEEKTSSHRSKKHALSPVLTEALADVND